MRDDILTHGRVTPFEIMDLLEAFAKLLEGRCPWSSEGIVLKKIITIEQNEWSYRNVYGNTVRSPHKIFQGHCLSPAYCWFYQFTRLETLARRLCSPSPYADEQDVARVAPLGADLLLQSPASEQ